MGTMPPGRPKPDDIERLNAPEPPTKREAPSLSVRHEQFTWNSKTSTRIMYAPNLIGILIVIVSLSLLIGINKGQYGVGKATV
jgi:uncharacterized membrane protein YkgB